MTIDPVTHLEDVHHQHASVGTYLKVAVILTVVTVCELCVPYTPHNLMPTGLGIFLLAILSLFKFCTVCMFFMHLYYDSRLMTFLFTIGFLIALGTMLSTKSLMNIHALEKPAPLSVKKAPLLPPSPVRGKAAFATQACITCHTIKEIPEARGTTGPPLDGVADRAGSREPGKDAKAYIEESITKPLAFIVPGYPPSMPADIRDTLSDQEYVDIVAYLMTLHNK